MTTSRLSASLLSMMLVASIFEPYSLQSQSRPSGCCALLQNCAACHGDKGRGDGAAGKYLKPPPPDFATSLKGKADDWIAKAIKGGGVAIGESPTMQAYASLSDDQVKALVAYIKSFNPELRNVLGTHERLLLLVVLGVAPALVTLATFALSFQRAEQVRFCADCHTMTPWVDDLHNPSSKSLAAMHFSNRCILHDQCYTCHADYGFLGPITTKLESLPHVAIYYGCIKMPKQIQLRKPFPNANCLQSPGSGGQLQKQSSTRGGDGATAGKSAELLTCHQPIHTPKG